MIVILLANLVAADDTCVIPADPDLLGIGIRLGVYFQLFGNLVIALVRPSEGVSSLTVSNIFFTGNLIALIHSMATSGVPPSVMINAMWFLLLDITLAIPILLTALSSEEEVNLSYWTVSFILLRWCVSNSLNIWFWFHGVDVPNPLQCQEPRAFLYANFGAYGNVRTAFKVFAAFGGVYTALWIFLGFIPSIYKREFIREGNFDERFKVDWKEYLPRHGEENDNPEHGGAAAVGVGIEPGESVAVGLTMFFTGTLTFAFAVMGVELQIRWNNLTGLGNIETTGQIIPLTIGCFSLFRALILAIVTLTGH